MALKVFSERVCNYCKGTGYTFYKPCKVCNTATIVLIPTPTKEELNLYSKCQHCKCQFLRPFNECPNCQKLMHDDLYVVEMAKENYDPLYNSKRRT